MVSIFHYYWVCPHAEVSTVRQDRSLQGCNYIPFMYWNLLGGGWFSVYDRKKACLVYLRVQQLQIALLIHTISQCLLASTCGQSPRINFKIPEKTDNVLKQHYSKLFMNLLVSFLNRKLLRILLFSHSHKK